MAEHSAGASVTVVGLADDRLELLGPEATAALSSARVVVGGRRHLAGLARWQTDHALDGRPKTLEITGDTDELMGQLRSVLAAQEGPVCVLASGDPGFFGIVRSLLRHLHRDQLRVLPAPSSISLAFARLRLPWDDAVVVSAHGRPLEEAVGVARSADKVAVLTSPEAPPQRVAQALIDIGCSVDLAAVCSRLGGADEEVHELTLAEVAEGEFDPVSVLVLLGPGALQLSGWSEAVPANAPPRPRVLAWGRDDTHYARRGGMITKAETRSVILGKLALPERGVLWDIGAGSGSVAVECGLLCPGLTIFAVERNPEDAERMSANASRCGVGIHVIVGEAPGALDGLPAPDRAFVGGGGVEVLESVLARMAPHGHVVASFAAMDRAVHAAGVLGHLVQLQAQRAELMKDGTWRLVANNPVFIAWGPLHGEEDQ